MFKPEVIKGSFPVLTVFHYNKKAGGIPFTESRRSMFIAAERKPNSVPVNLSIHRGGHFSVTQIALRLGWTSHPATYPRIASLSPWAGALRIFGLAAGGVCRAISVTTDAVRSYRTISPLRKLRLGAAAAVSFCCTFRRIAPP
jgi:hypothetical protein